MSRGIGNAVVRDGSLPAGFFEPCLHSSYLHVFTRHISGQSLALAGRPRLLPIIEFLPLLEEIGARTNPEEGIALGLSIPLTAHGALAISTLSSENLWNAMVTLARYTPLRNAMFTYRAFQDENAAIVECRSRANLGDYEPFFGYATALAIYNVLKDATEEALPETIRLCFPWKRPASLPSSSIPAVCRFEAGFLGVSAPLDLATRPSQIADRDLFDRLKMAVEGGLTVPGSSNGTKVRQLLQQRSRGWPSLQDVADALAMSKRTLIRKLEAEDLSYQLLLDEARRDLACSFLRRPDMRLSEIAERLGFSDQAGFTRSFRRMQGCSPSQYRAQLRASPAAN